jgi:hypothetical protein
LPIFYWAEKRFARALAKEQLGFYRKVLSENPDLPKLEIYSRTLMLRPGYDAERAHALVREAEADVSSWPHDRDLAFRDVVHHLAVSEYLERNPAEGSGTHVVFKGIIDKLIPADL